MTTAATAMSSSAPSRSIEIDGNSLGSTRFLSATSLAGSDLRCLNVGMLLAKPPDGGAPDARSSSKSICAVVIKLEARL